MTDTSQPKIYFAAPLFNPMERKFNSDLASRMGQFSTVFLPQRDGLLLTELVRNGMAVEKARKQVFAADCKAVSSCDVLIAVLDGRTVDEGVAFEIGYANALLKPCIGLKTDDRSMLPTGDNPMIVESCSRIFHDADGLVTYLSAWASDRSSVSLLRGAPTQHVGHSTGKTTN
jgi:nucleoside 2-deoxyribosyltransferase